MMLLCSFGVTNQKPVLYKEIIPKDCSAGYFIQFPIVLMFAEPNSLIMHMILFFSVFFFI